MKGFTGASDNTYKETVNRAYFDDNATVFVKYKNDDYKVVTGEAARSGMRSLLPWSVC